MVSIIKLVGLSVLSKLYFYIKEKPLLDMNY